MNALSLALYWDKFLKRKVKQHSDKASIIIVGMWLLQINSLALISLRGAIQQCSFTFDDLKLEKNKCQIFVGALWIQPLYSVLSPVILGPENSGQMMKIVTNSLVNMQVISPSYFL